MMTTIWDLIANWKQFDRNPLQTGSDLADQELDLIASKREKIAGKPQVKCGLTREAKRWQSFQPWGRA